MIKKNQKVGKPRKTRSCEIESISYFVISSQSLPNQLAKAQFFLQTENELTWINPLFRNVDIFLKQDFEISNNVRGIIFRLRLLF